MLELLQADFACSVLQGSEHLKQRCEFQTDERGICSSRDADWVPSSSPSPWSCPWLCGHGLAGAVWGWSVPPAAPLSRTQLLPGPRAAPWLLPQFPAVPAARGDWGSSARLQLQRGGSRGAHGALGAHGESPGLCWAQAALPWGHKLPVPSPALLSAPTAVEVLQLLSPAQLYAVACFISFPPVPCELLRNYPALCFQPFTSQQNGFFSLLKKTSELPKHHGALEAQRKAQAVLGGLHRLMSLYQ